MLWCCRWARQSENPSSICIAMAGADSPPVSVIKTSLQQIGLGPYQSLAQARTGMQLHA